MSFDIPKRIRNESAYEPAENNTHYIEYEFQQAQNMNRIFVNRTSWAPLENNATIWKASELSDSWSVPGSYNNYGGYLNQQILANPDADGAVQLFINSLDAMLHPWHLQGHDFQVVGWGPGLFGNIDSTTT
jgi:FtsP/CotA-like multicopper oxidase with cupredoxin domain